MVRACSIPPGDPPRPLIKSKPTVTYPLLAAEELTVQAVPDFRRLADRRDNHIRFSGETNSGVEKIRTHT
jgi:hypothetical protein